MTTARGVRQLRRIAIVVAVSTSAAVLTVVTAGPAAAVVSPRCLASPAVLPVASGGSGDTYSLDANGSLWGWGSNYFGEIGNGSRTDATLPLNASGFNSLQAVTAGANSVLVLRQDGTVWGWGDDQVGQLGDGRSGADVMSVVPAQVPGLTNVVAVTASQSNGAFALKSDGTAWAWGWNDDGQLGDGTRTTRAVPTQIPALTGVTAIATANQFSLAVKSDGSVWAWGRNNYGQLGSNVPLATNQLTPVQVPGISGVVAVAAGSAHSLALKSDGTVWSWGQGAMGQLGNAAFGNTSTPVQVSGLSGVTAISAGTAYSMALKSDGTAWTWGQNMYGELGNPAGATYQSTPVQVSTIGGVSALNAGANAAVAVTSGGGVWDWGANFYGEIGNGTVNAGGAPQRSPYRVSVTQAVPAAPKNLAAVAGNALAYLTWAPPQAAITQYVITPYLNGVAQAQVVAPAGASTATLTGMVIGGNYTFTVAAQNCLGTGAASAQSKPVIPTGVQSGGLEQSLESASLTDRIAVQVNTFNGNLSVNERDLAIKGTGLDLVLNRTYNNRGSTSSIFGRKWTVSGGTGVSLTVLGDGSVLFNGPGGLQVGFAKNADGTYTPPSGIDSTLIRNGDGTYTLTANASGETWKFSSAGAALSRTDRNANTISYTYTGPAGTLSAITDTQGRVTTLSYNAASLVSTVTDLTGRLYQYGYDASQQLTNYTDPAGGVTRFGYDASYNLTRITTPAGRVVGFGYDTFGRVTSMSHPLQAGNPTSTYTYNGDGTVVTDANGRTTTYTYDPVGRTTTVVDGLGNVASASYTSNSNVSTYSSGSGAAKATFGYDNVNNPTSAAVQPGAHTTLGYTDPNHPFSPTTVTDPQNNTSTLAYDAAGNVVRKTDALAAQNQVLTPRNPNGTMASSTDPDGHLTSYGYDADGNLTSQTDAAVGTGPVTTMTYDGLGRLTRRTTPDGISVAYSYDGVGNLLTLTDPGGTTTYAYNPVNLPTRVTDPAGKVITLGYDANYNRTSVGYPNGITMYSTYDAANRLVNAGSTVGSYSYTPAGPSRGSGRAVTMVGSPSTYASSGTLSSAVTLATPTGLTAGQVELAQISVAGNASVSIPAGWAEIREDRTGSTSSDLRQILYVHVAGPSEPAVYSWQLSQPTDANGALTAWTGVDTSSPVAASAGRVAPTAGTSMTAPSVAFQNGELSMAFYGARLASGAAALSVPAGYTSAYDTQTSPITVGLDIRTLGPVAGSTADQTITGPSSRWVGQQLLLRPVYDTSLRQSTPAGVVSYDALNRVTSAPAGPVSIGNSIYAYDGAGNRLTQSRGPDTVSYTTNAANQLTQLRKTILAVGTGIGKSTAGQSTFTVDLPAGIRASDQILVAVSQTDADTAYLPGYSAVKIAVSGANPTDATTAVYRRTATGDETTVTISASPGAIQSAAVVVYRGVDPVNPVDAVGSAGAIGPSLTYPSLTAGMTGERLVAVQGAVNNATPGAWTAPVSMTEVVQNTEQSLRSVGIADRALPAAGATGSMSTSIATGGAPAQLAGVALTLRPAAPSYTYDGSGDLTGASDGTALAYDAAHRTTGITGPGGTAVTVTYRGAGQSERATISDARRVSRDCPEIGGCVPTTISLGGPVTFEHSVLGVTAETDATSTTYYLRDPRGGLLAQRTPTGGTFYYLLDGLGSVTGLTDSTGSRAASYTYDAYGQTTSMSTSTVGINNPWRYVGAYQDGTGLYKMGARYYDPTLGRFTQQDPIFNPLDPKSWNRYAYAGNDPINFSDLTGLEACGAELKFEAAKFLAETLAWENVLLFLELAFPEAGLVAKGVTWIVRPASFLQFVRGAVSFFRSYAESRPC